MNTAELWKIFNRQWKEKNQTKYVAWLIAEAVSCVAVVFICALGLLGEVDRTTASVAVGFLGLAIAMQVVAFALKLGRKKDWKQYLAEHQNMKQ